MTISHVAKIIDVSERQKGEEKRRLIEATVVRLEVEARELLRLTSIGTFELDHALEFSIDDIPQFSLGVRKLNGLRVTALEHWARYWQPAAEAGGVRAADVRRHDITFYNALAQYQRRQGGSISDLFPKRPSLRGTKPEGAEGPAPSE